MIVAADTSPLTNLAAIGRFELLRDFFGEIHIPDAVWAKLHAGDGRWPGAREVAGATWIRRHTVKNTALVRALLRELDGGESETIALAVELPADLLLVDERSGRRAAQEMGFQVSGVVGLLVRAKTSGRVPSLELELRALQVRAGFRLAEAVVHRALVEVGERR